jgi:hypothetical protein
MGQLLRGLGGGAIGQGIGAAGRAVRCGAEARRIDAKYLNSGFVNNHLNLAFGFEF